MIEELELKEFKINPQFPDILLRQVNRRHLPLDEQKQPNNHKHQIDRWMTKQTSERPLTLLVPQRKLRNTQFDILRIS